jgi:hypothetical protein
MRINQAGQNHLAHGIDDLRAVLRLHVLRMTDEGDTPVLDEYHSIIYGAMLRYYCPADYRQLMIAFSIHRFSTHDSETPGFWILDFGFWIGKRIE